MSTSVAGTIDGSGACECLFLKVLKLCSSRAIVTDRSHLEIRHLGGTYAHALTHLAFALHDVDWVAPIKPCLSKT